MFSAVPCMLLRIAEYNRPPVISVIEFATSITIALTMLFVWHFVYDVFFVKDFEENRDVDEAGQNLNPSDSPHIQSYFSLAK